MCIPDGDLRAKLDGELLPAQAAKVEAHLAECGRCRRRSEELAARAEAVGNLFTQVAADAGTPDAAAAYARFQSRRRRAESESQPLLARLFAGRWAKPAWGAVALVALVTLSVASGPTRALAAKLLGLLRVNKVVVVPLQRDFVAEGQGKLLSNLLADSVTVTKDEKEQNASTREEASRLAGFSVRLPSMRSDTPRFVIEGEHALEFVANTKRLEALMSLLGRPDLTLPEGLDSAKVAVDIPRAVLTAYGNCPKRGSFEVPPDQWAGCVMLTQVPTPVVVTVPELNLSAIAEVGLQLAGMPQDEARAFSRTVDWTSTLAIPLPRDAATYQTVSIDGVEGVLIETRQRMGHPAGHMLIWIKNGIVYSLVGFGNPSMAVPLAESLS